MNVVSIVGVRPQFIKASTVSRALAAAGIEEGIVHSGQHYDANMSQVFFDELELRPPIRHLGIGAESNARQVGRMLIAIEEVIRELDPRLVIVYGDTNTTLAGAIAANALHVPLAHVEAGLRSFNRAMPEELNRVLTDHCSDLLFCPTQTSVDNLAREGLRDGVHLVGDVMYDELLRNVPRAQERSRILDQLGLEPGEYYLATIHRAQSTDDPATLAGLVDGLTALDHPVVLPLHPRTRARLQDTPGLLARLEQEPVRLIEPVGYLDMLRLEQGARAILTDSGGVQKEAYFLGRPCITLRAETEWTETIDAGWNVLVGYDPAAMVAAARGARPGTAQGTGLFGGGNAAASIAAIVQQAIKGQGSRGSA
jgi:UDP-N-acetylglucosamine 2-epimerase